MHVGRSHPPSVSPFFVLLSIAACGGDPSPEDYCRKREDAWARAFPEEAAKQSFRMESCPRVIAKEQSDQPVLYAQRMLCFREHIHEYQTGKAANDAYTAMTNCEAGSNGPQGISTAK